MKILRNKTSRPTPPADLNGSDPVREGLVVAHHGVAVEVLFDDGERRLVRVKRSSGHVVGDAVLVTGEVLKRLPRRTELNRRDARGGIHLVAANLDLLGIVVAPQSPLGFVDRAIVAARVAELRPFVVVNKCDLPETQGLLADLETIYAGTIPLFPVSAVERRGLDALLAFFSGGHRGAFVGSTGVGKSSLLNALCPDIELKVGAVSDYKSMGRHTTVVSTLHTLPGGGELIDTPGFRDFGLVAIAAEDLSLHFPGLEARGETVCRFRNCRHRTEPRCAVIAGVEEGRIAQERYATYLELLDEIESGDAA